VLVLTWADFQVAHHINCPGLAFDLHFGARRNVDDKVDAIFFRDDRAL